MNETCMLGSLVFETKVGPCPALQREGNIFVCGLVTHPDVYAHPCAMERQGPIKLSKSARFLIASGIGCDAQLDELDRPTLRYSIARFLRKYSPWIKRTVFSHLFTWFGGIDVADVS